MCSISGFIVIGDARPDRLLLAREFHQVLLAGTPRGSDSFGIQLVTRSGQLREWKGIAAPTLTQIEDLITDDVSALVATTRATPTTEWEPGSGVAHVQPFCHGGWAVAHNGTIANDRELADELGERPAVRVDSAVLPHAFARWGFVAGLRRIKGSFAIAALEVSAPRILRLAKNYKPLHVMRHAELPAAFFASAAGQLVDGPSSDQLSLSRPHVENFAPYHVLTIDGARGQLDLQPLEDEAARPPRRALVVASGGMDSTVTATLLRRQGLDVTLVHFLYQCRAQQAEVRAVEAIARALDCGYRYVPLDWLAKLGGSSLTEPGAEIASGEAGAEFAHEWVPARNMLMIACACAIADADGFTDIALGTNLEEGGAYPDNTQEFIAAMDAASQLGTMQRARVHSPVGNLVKHQIVRLGVDIGAPLHLTWSCYRDGEVHCGDCGPCYMRQMAFQMNQLPDPVGYISEPGLRRGAQLAGSGSKHSFE